MRHATLVGAGVVGYGLLAWLGLMLAIPPGYASPIWPASGFALALTLVYGWVPLVGCAFAHAALNAWTSSATVSPSAVAWSSLGIALGGVVQVLLVRAALHGAMPRWPIELTDVTCVIIYLAVTAMGGTVSASAGMLSLYATGVVSGDMSHLWFSWWTWVAGDGLGLMLVTPVVLAMLKAPPAIWAQRRMTIAFPMSALCGFLTCVYWQSLVFADERFAWSVMVWSLYGASAMLGLLLVGTGRIWEMERKSREHVAMIEALTADITRRFDNIA